nr:MAG TPA: hypothetical protein [Caudoviricetes sp.]
MFIRGNTERTPFFCLKKSPKFSKSALKISKSKRNSQKLEARTNPPHLTVYVFHAAGCLCCTGIKKKSATRYR